MFKRDDLAEKIYAIGVLQQNYVTDQLKKIQLNSLQARSLNYIMAHPGTMQRDLADYLGKQQATVTNILKALEEKALIYREIPKENERQKNIYLTESGKAVVKKVQAIFEELDTEVRVGLSETKQVQLQQELAQIETHLRNVLQGK